MATRWKPVVACPNNGQDIESDKTRPKRNFFILFLIGSGYDVEGRAGGGGVGDYQSVR